MTLFAYHAQIALTYPRLVTALMVIEDLQDLQDYEAAVVGLEDQARHLLDDRTEAELPAIRAWRSAFAAMGVRPTQYRCAAEALLRRLRKDGALPRMTPLVDLCNALSAAHAVPVAAFDLDRIMGDLTVGPAAGSETYLSFGGQTEQPAAGEIVFVDAAGTVHARRWTHRQSATSAVSPATRRALIVIEGLHETAETDVAAALDALARIMSHHGTSVRRRLLRGGAGAFDMGAAA